METGNLHVSKKAQIDNIHEYTLDAGITLDSNALGTIKVLIKDGEVNGVVVELHAGRHVTGGADKIRDATSLQDGLMTLAYAGKLDGIAAGANDYTHPNHSGDVVSVGDGAQTIQDDVVTYAKMQNVVADQVILGNVGGAGGIVDELTATEVRTLINVEDGADVTDATNVDAAGATMNTDASLSGNNYFLDEDDFASDSDTQAASQQSIKAYVDSVASGLIVKDSCRVATNVALPAYIAAGGPGVGRTITITAAGTLTIDGILTVLGDRVLVKNGGATGLSTHVDNGFYEVTTAGAVGVSAVLTRATDFDTDAEVLAGSFTFVEEGTVNQDQGWVLSTDNPITVDTTALTFSQFSGAGTINAGAGLTKTGDTLDVGAGTGITVNVNDIEVNYGAVADTACEGDDARLTDARTPTAHAPSHKTGGTDEIDLDELGTPSDNTNLNATTTYHGLLRKLDDDDTHYLNGKGEWASAGATTADMKANSFTMGSALFDRISDPTLLVLQTDVPTGAATCHDYSSVGNDGIFMNTDADERIEQGTVWVLDLNGTDEYIEFADDASLSLDEMTAGAVINVTLGTTKQSIVTKMDETAGFEAREYELFVNATEHLVFRVYDESADAWVGEIANVALSAGYHYVCATYNGKSGGSAAITLYVDGVVAASTADNSGTFVAMEDLATTVKIGALEGTTGAVADYWVGEIGVVYLDGVEWAASDIWSMWLEFVGRYNI